MQITVRRAGAALVLAALAVAAQTTAAGAAPAHPAAATSGAAARSVLVQVDNWTQCEMDFVSASLSSGTWTGIDWPPATITNSTWGVWQSESNGFMTGTEGKATYQLHKCVNPADEYKWVSFHWDNPYAGSNSYDTKGTSSGVKITRSGGSGDNAVVSFVVKTG
ncbi:aegerolysin family protein [Kitasatospora sp. NPDC059571]|uniref:aegerolysin family protein n=1 Tax=Kitasatospora sp. NPDC059571 TaxID=3346871 RepID=UPI00367FB12C